MFRPCIDLHDGVVKQIVGGTLKSAEEGESEKPVTNFVAELPAEHFAKYVFVFIWITPASIVPRTDAPPCDGMQALSNRQLACNVPALRQPQPLQDSSRRVIPKGQSA